MDPLIDGLNRLYRYNADERAAFERSIDENPLESTGHLAYADWLDEHNEPEEAAFRRELGGLSPHIRTFGDGSPDNPTIYAVKMGHLTDSMRRAYEGWNPSQNHPLPHTSWFRVNGHPHLAWYEHDDLANAVRTAMENYPNHSESQ